MEIAVPIADVIDRLQKRWAAGVAEAAQEWSASVSALSRWEDDNLLGHPTPELLANHQATLDRLLAFGSVLSLAADGPGFPDRSISEMVAATQALLHDKARMWHRSRMSKAESDRILAECFPDAR
jgi:hypothetical protein